MNNYFDLTDKVAIITGGGVGLGKQMAIALGESGANIVICSRKIENCLQTVAELKQKGVQAIAVPCDISKQKDIDHVIQTTIKKFGSIDILINNSGTSWMAPTLDYPEDKWDKVMDINLKGTFLFSKAAAKKMAEHKKGKIINISSVTAFQGTHPSFLDAISYNTSKGAIITLTKELSVKLAPYNIQVNAIAPGFFPTKITSVFEQHKKQILAKIPAGRLGAEEDLKGIALLLSSQASDYITGQIIAVDGGLSSML
ncbi:SDR family oxidoreductase [Niallia sp. NCCP-28]|uniref:SDR family oxidoreductase n=1 Tax=Niallia sp. NCCP-28 TaxID=2934712 RepID=UPI002084BEB7|nr:SDR family oxidoreductase [Niallia sp. NCCP-28]GKU83177.1 gluconate 5-dehydrogenase [Niallia sp. NCCP-28]